MSQTHVADEAYREARDHFSEKELVDLTMAVVVINRWNRPAISFRTPPGTYSPHGDEGRAVRCRACASLKGWNGAADTGAAMCQGGTGDRAASLRQNRIGPGAGASSAKMSEPGSSAPV